MLRQRKIKQEELIDTGFSSKYPSTKQRIIRADGSFSIKKKGLNFWQTLNFYHFLINLNWVRFIFLIIFSYLAANCIFSALYVGAGVENLGINKDTLFNNYLNAFFFSAQTMTTVGYGRENPMNISTNILASVQSFIGLLMFAFSASILYARFSRPVAKILYSSNVVILAMNGKNALMLRLANMHKSQIIDMQAKLVFSKIEERDGTDFRTFVNLKLEYARINFLASSWTIVHIIDEDSPLYGLTEEDCAKSEVEILVQLQGYDDSFTQHIHSRNSYTFDEFQWGKKFTTIFGYDEDGYPTIALDKIHNTEPAELIKLSDE